MSLSKQPASCTCIQLSSRYVNTYLLELYVVVVLAAFDTVLLLFILHACTLILWFQGLRTWTSSTPMSSVMLIVTCRVQTLHFPFQIVLALICLHREHSVAPSCVCWVLHQHCHFEHLRYLMIQKSCCLTCEKVYVWLSHIGIGYKVKHIECDGVVKDGAQSWKTAWDGTLPHNNM